MGVRTCTDSDGADAAGIAEFLQELVEYQGPGREFGFLLGREPWTPGAVASGKAGTLTRPRTSGGGGGAIEGGALVDAGSETEDWWRARRNLLKL